MKISLRGTKASLITLSKDVSDPSARQPAVGIFAPLEKYDGPRVPKRPDGLITGFIIRDISPASKKEFDARVKLTFTAGSNSHPDQEIEYNIVLPVQYVASAMALSALREPLGGLPLAIIDSAHYKANESVPMMYESVSFMLVFPMKETLESEQLSEKLDAVIHENYTTALTPVSWDKVIVQSGESTNPNLSIAQGMMFQNLIALARGDIGALLQIMSMEEHIDLLMGDDGEEDEEDFYEDLTEYAGEHESDEELDETIAQQLEDIRNAPLPEPPISEEEQELREVNERVEQMKRAIYPLCFNIVDTMLDRIKNFDPSIKSTIIGGTESVDLGEYDATTDIVFNELTSSLEQMFADIDFKDKTPAEEKRTKDIAYWNSPIRESCPSLEPIFTFLESSSDYADYLSILSMDILSDETASTILEDYKLGKVFTSMCITIVAYTLKKGMIISDYDSDLAIPAPEIISNLIRVNDTDFVWEIPSLTKSLINYDIGNTVDVLCMNYKPSKSIERAGYLLNSINYLAEMFIHNPIWSAISVKDLRAKLDGFADNTSEFKEFKEWLTQFYGLLKGAHTQHEDKETARAAYGAISEFLHSEHDVKKLASHVARTFIAVVDILALLQDGMHEDHPEWNDYRGQTLNALLVKIAEEVGSRMQFAIR